jgi:diguanylate cyclase (GGDEF)-like protein
MNESPEVPTLQAARDETQRVLHFILVFASLLCLVVSALGVLVVSGREEPRSLSFIVQVAVVLGVLSAVVRLLFPGPRAYAQAAALLCWSVTLGMALRIVSAFVFDSDAWLMQGRVPFFVAWAPIVLLGNIVFLPLRQGLVLSGIFYLLVMGSMLTVIHHSLSAGVLPPDLLSVTVYLLFAGVPICVGALTIMARQRNRYETLAQDLEHALELERQNSEIDDVTGCLNRRGLFRFLDGVKAGSNSLLAAIELDNMQQHLQILGGKAAQALLQRLGRKLRAAASADAVVGRWDGARFYVYLPDLGGQTPAQAAHGLWSVLADSKPEVSGLPTFSVGACVPPPDSDAGDYLEEADLQLLLAQAEGGNRVRIASVENPA